MANNNNISIDVEINASGRQQLNQYSKAFNNLRTSIIKAILFDIIPISTID